MFRTNRILFFALFALIVAACGGGTATETTTADTTAPAETAAGADESTAPETVVVTDPSDVPATTVSAVDQTAEIAEGMTISLDYTGTLDDGEEFDSSIGGTPLQFTVGSGQVIAGFDEAVLGTTVGETKTFRIEPENAYGLPDPELLIGFPIDEVPAELHVVGTEVQLPTGQRGIVSEITATEVIVDANHNLAGEALTFEITILEILG